MIIKLITLQILLLMFLAGNYYRKELNFSTYLYLVWNSTVVS